MPLLQPPLQLEAFEDRGRMDSGVTRPFRVVARSEHAEESEVVLKLRHPDHGGRASHFEGTSLACELICAALARLLDLAVPDYAVVGVSRDFAEAALMRVDQDVLRRNRGANFGSVMLDGVASWDGHLQEIPEETRLVLADILAFDAIVLNADRTAFRPNLLDAGDQIYLIDHSLALVPEQLASQTRYYTPHQISNHVAFASIRNRGMPFTSIVTRWRERVNADELASLRRAIPKKWERSRGDLDCIFDFLVSRSQYLGQIQHDLRAVVR